MDAPFFLVPGEQELLFSIKRKSSTTINGRVSYDEILLSSIEGTISEASQNQKHEWNQMNHPITHTIVVRGACEVGAEDILEDSEKQNYHVQGTTNPSGLGFFTIIFCKMVRWDNGNEDPNPDIT